jgi:hypothetical protein
MYINQEFMDGRSPIELKKRRSTTYMGLMRQPFSVNALDIWKQKMTIDLYRVYGEYHYGIFYPERLGNES